MNFLSTFVTRKGVGDVAGTAELKEQDLSFLSETEGLVTACLVGGALMKMPVVFWDEKKI